MRVTVESLALRNMATSDETMTRMRGMCSLRRNHCVLEGIRCVGVPVCESFGGNPSVGVPESESLCGNLRGVPLQVECCHLLRSASNTKCGIDHQLQVSRCCMLAVLVLVETMTKVRGSSSSSGNGSASARARARASSI